MKGLSEMPLSSDTRAQSIGISNFFLALLVGAVMTWIIGAIARPVHSQMEDRTAAGDVVGLTMNDWIGAVIDNQPILFLLIAFFSLIAISIYQRQRLG